MKILFLSDHFHPEPSAPAAHVYERARLWVRAGHEVTVICSAPNFPEGRVYEGYRNALRTVESLHGIRVVRVKTFIARNEGTIRRTLDYLSYMFSAWFFSLFERRPDVVVSSSPHLFVAVAGVLTGLCRRRPHVFEIRDLWPASIGATAALGNQRILMLLERLELWLYRRSTRMLALTPSFKSNLVERGVSPDRIDVVINGANLELFKKCDEKNSEILEKFGLQGRFVIGYLGTIGLAHGLESVVKAATLLRGSRVTFFFVGVGAAREDLERQVAAQSLHNVKFAPRQRKEEMPRFWSVCDASLVHLRDEPVFAKVIPSKIFESMAVGVPMLYAVPEGDGSAIVRRHEAGIIVPPMNPAALARAATTLEGNPDLCRRLASNSHSAAREYSRERQAFDSVTVFQRAVDDYQGASSQ